MLKKLKAAGTLDQAIAELKQRAAGSPDDPAIPTAIGEALMNKFPIADSDESAMNGLQMDQSFNKALKLDPANWEAQFFKAIGTGLLAGGHATKPRKWCNDFRP